MRPVPAVAALLLVLPVVAAAEPPPAVPLYRAFGRWFVACDNVRSCQARGFDEATQADLRLVRDAGAAPATLTLSSDGPLDPDALKLDGTALDVRWTATPGTANSLATLAITDPAAVAAFVAKARNAHAMTLDTAPSDPPRAVPLDGFTASMLLIDAVQGRPGTPTALVAPVGPGSPPPASPLPPAPAWHRPPPLSAAEARAVAARVASLRSPVFGRCTAEGPTSVDALDATRAIAIRPCYNAAYQSSALVEIVPRAGGAPVPVRLALPGLPRRADDPGAGTEGPDMTEPGFDPKTGQLGTSAKGRGLADCGTSATWVWSEGAFRLTDLAYQDQCGGAQPGDWPTLYRVQPSPAAGGPPR